MKTKLFQKPIYTLYGVHKNGNKIIIGEPSESFEDIKKLKLSIFKTIETNKILSDRTLLIFDNNNKIVN